MSPRKKQKLDELISKFKQGDKRALARLITMIETDPLLGKEIFKHYKNPLSKSYIIGITGPPGAGKSFLVQALGYQAIKSGFLVYYRSVFDVVRDFMQDEAFGGQDKVLTKYLKPDLVLIDDMGMKQLPNRSGYFN